MSKRKGNSSFNKYNIKWIIVITIWTFFLAIFFNIIAEGLVENLDVGLSFLVLILIVCTGVFFDIIGVAVTSAEEKPFHSMASNKVEEAKVAIRLVWNAGQVSNFCNDVIGDISGIVSGAIGPSIIYKLVKVYDITNTVILSI